MKRRNLPKGVIITSALLSATILATGCAQVDDVSDYNPSSENVVCGYGPVESTSENNESYSIEEENTEEEIFSEPYCDYGVVEDIGNSFDKIESDDFDDVLNNEELEDIGSSFDDVDDSSIEEILASNDSEEDMSNMEVIAVYGPTEDYGNSDKTESEKLKESYDAGTDIVTAVYGPPENIDNNEPILKKIFDNIVDIFKK